MKVLFLSAWYPTDRDAMAGLFVQKHAQAVAQQGAEVRVLYSDAQGGRWWQEMCRGWRKLKKEWGLPDVVQLNVIDKNGLLALWLKRRYGIPYAIIEHWSGYLPANYSFKEGLHGRMVRKIAQEASCILPVSQMLEDAMKQCGIQNAHWQRIHNVVDDFFYQPITPLTIPARPKDKCRLLHVSCFDEKAKNIQGMLRAVRQVAQERQDFELVVVGTGADFAQDVQYAESLAFPEGMLLLTGEQTPREVAQWMQESDAFVLFSRYENAPVVLSECLVVGLPIVTSNAGGIPEMVTSEEGVLVASEDENALATALMHMIDHHAHYSTAAIRRRGEQYTAHKVGTKLMNIYCQVTGR